MRIGSETLVLWGAGATASLGFSTTQQQASQLWKLIGSLESVDTLKRCQSVFPENHWALAMKELLLILGDNDALLYDVSRISIAAMRDNWADVSEDALVRRIHHLRSLFDWQALKEVARICPGFASEKKFFRLQDLFNVIDIHVQNFHGFKAENEFLPPQRLIAARRALQLILNSLQFVEWQIASRSKADQLGIHLDFARHLTALHQKKGLELASSGCAFDTREFYLGSIAFISLNYDPVALWAQFIANKDANGRAPHVDFPAVPLKIFHDFGIFMAVSTIDSQKESADKKERVWYPLNESSAQRLNDRDHTTGRRVRINKYLLPHGSSCWRECPNCGKLTAFMGKTWQIGSPALIPPPPLRRFAKFGDVLASLYPESKEEEDAWGRGEVDARECVHCGVMTFAQHTQTIQQSNFKQNPPSFIEEVQRDMRVATQAAKHIILLGYSLPPDDVTYRAFFAARQQREGSAVQCSVVIGINYGDVWHTPVEIDDLLLKMKTADPLLHSTLEGARAIFEKQNVRFYGGGFPQVICDSGKVTTQKFERLIHFST
jgi:Zn ribbon nucleic-acid-binding protein